jgi:scyllo-inositol 2-dehydrogenase (NADP+)
MSAHIGIVGFGRIGAKHAGWISAAGGAVAVADTTEARRQMARKRGFAVYENFESMLEDGDVDAVLIATPTAFHHQLAMAALRARKHVMAEKPMAMSFAHGMEMVEAAGKAGRILSVFHNRRWDRDFLTVQAAIASGVFGKIINVESRLGQWASCVGPAAPEYRPEWRNEATFGGGGLLDWGSHFADQILLLMLPAKPVRVFAQLRGNVWTRDSDDLARMVIDFDNAAVGLVEINTTTTRPLARWHIDGIAGSASSPFSLDFDTQKWAQFDFATPEGKLQRLPLAQSGLTETQIWRQFFEAIAGRGEPAVTAESVLPTMALLDAARDSSRLGQAVSLG